MKQIFLLILLLTAAFSISAQISGAADASNLAVIEKKWSFTKQPYSLLDTSKPFGDPQGAFSANDSQREFSQAVKENTRQNEIRTAQGLPRLPPPTRGGSSSNDSKTPADAARFYKYQVKVKNTGQKTIRFVTWDYVFFDNTKKTEAGRRHFITAKKIRAGETGKLSEKSFSYPTNTIDAAQGDKKFNEQYSERIIIQKIEYSDGTVWNAASH